MPRDNFQTAAQVKRAQTHPGSLPKMRRQSWEANKVGLSGRVLEMKKMHRERAPVFKPGPFKSSAEYRLAYAHEETILA